MRSDNDNGTGTVGHRAGQVRSWGSELGETIARAFTEFLTIPTYVILGFFVLAIGSYLLDRANPTWLAPMREMLRTHVFADPAATSSLLSTIAAGLITVTSITISLLLLALQQSAATMTAEILDQFLRRRANQAYFGFFIGLALYSLITLVTVAKPFNPIFGATFAFFLTVAALYLLIVLLYTRPSIKCVRCKSWTPFTITSLKRGSASSTLFARRGGAPRSPPNMRLSL